MLDHNSLTTIFCCSRLIFVFMDRLIALIPYASNLFFLFSSQQIKTVLRKRTKLIKSSELYTNFNSFHATGFFRYFRVQKELSSMKFVNHYTDGHLSFVSEYQETEILCIFPSSMGLQDIMLIMTIITTTMITYLFSSLSQNGLLLRTYCWLYIHTFQSRYVLDYAMDTLIYHLFHVLVDCSICKWALGFRLLHISNKLVDSCL